MGGMPPYSLQLGAQMPFQFSRHSSCFSFGWDGVSFICILFIFLSRDSRMESAGRSFPQGLFNWLLSFLNIPLAEAAWIGAGLGAITSMAP